METVRRRLFCKSSSSAALSSPRLELGAAAFSAEAAKHAQHLAFGASTRGARDRPYVAGSSTCRLTVAPSRALSSSTSLPPSGSSYTKVDLARHSVSGSNDCPHISETERGARVPRTADDQDNLPAQEPPHCFAHKRMGRTCRSGQGQQMWAKEVKFAARIPSCCGSQVASFCNKQDTCRSRSVQTFAAWGQDIEWTPVKVKQSYKAAEGVSLLLQVHQLCHGFKGCCIADWLGWLLQLQTVILDIGALGLSYQKGGQFLQLKVGDSSPGFYAIASGPDPGSKGVIELLIKKAGDTAERVCSAPEGSTPDQSHAQDLAPLPECRADHPTLQACVGFRRDQKRIVAGSEIHASPVMGKGFPIDKCPPETFPTLLIFCTGSGISPIRSLIESDALQACGPFTIVLGQVPW